ncbi:MAG: class I tRNA ligase family protein, partial [Patescibacteria group bacterium]
MSQFDFQKTEQNIRQFWRDHHIFQKSLDLRRRAKRFVFFEGPPTANGLPHIGHFLTRIYKDLYGRYKTMRGYFVLRKAGWDTHGLPVEIEVEKQLGFTNKKQIEEYGIAAFNRKARESVWKYQREWEEMTERMGFWVDLQDSYVTYESSYIESLWYVMRQIWDKKLLYKAHRVVPFCTRCGTALSSHEVAQGYKVVKDTSVYIKFKITSGKFKDAFILAWTTTPWTLPGNVALAVGNNIEYIIAEHGGEHFVLAKDVAEKVLGSTPTIVETLKGSDLVGLHYEPLFDVPALKSGASYQIYEADFLSTSEGTGVV